MINFLDVNKFKKGLTPITTTEYFSKPGEFHPEGLFSEMIFGAEESPERKKTFSYINLNANVIHPSAYMLLMQLDRNIEKFVSSEETFSVDSNGLLVKDPDGVTGITEFIKIFPKIKFRGGTDTRDKFIKKVKQAYESNTLFINIIPVIPPTQRDAYQDEKGLWIIDPLNDYYVAIIRRSYQVKSAAKSGPLFDLLNFELQKAIINHDNFIRKLIQKKRGLIRSQMLGKRTDFSGRSVITPGPDLKVNEIGIPLRMAVSLFEPFIIHRLFSGRVDQSKLSAEVKNFTNFELSIDSIKQVFKAIKSGDNIPKTLYDMIFEATEVAMMNRVVIAKRDPVLHAESVRGFKPILIEGNTVQICTLQVGGFNADFDGDTMAIFHPITNEAQEEVKNRMMRSEGGENDDSVNFELSKEMAVGLYSITKNVSRTTPAIYVTDKDLENATDPYIPVVYRKHTTTMGKALFNSAFPSNFPFYEGVVTKKYANNLASILLKKYGQKQAIESFSKLKSIGFKFSTIMAPSITLDEIQLPDEILELKKKLQTASIEEAAVILEEANKLLVKHLEGTGLYDLVESGAGKGWKQPMQILVAKGLIADPSGKVLEPIKGSFADGLSNKEYFTAAAGARKGIIDRVLNTAETGYMARKLAYVLNSVEIDRQLKDCKTKRTLDLRLTKDLASRLKGRYVLENNKPQLFDVKDYKIGNQIHLRTPVFCESPKLCHTCYGKLLDRHRSPYAGVMAAQIVGEAGTQTIMKCADGLVHYNNTLIPFVDLFKLANNYNECDGIETAILEQSIKGKDGYTNTKTIQRHMPHSDLLFISTSGGNTLICQENHPLWIKRDNIHNVYENKYCNLIGDEIYTEYKGGRKIFNTENNKVIEKIASDIQKYDAIWIDNTDSINNEQTVKPNLRPYIAGIYMAEGVKCGNNRRIKQNRICQTTPGPIRERIYDECKKEFIHENEKVTLTNDGINIWDDTRRINDIILGDYAWEKRLNKDFINYDKEWLKEFLSGLIDGDGSVFTNTSTCCRIYSTSYYLIQQITAICFKLGYQVNTCLGSYSKKYGRIRTYFQLDIRFYKNPYLSSIKFNTVEFKSITRNKNRKAIKGFDKITKIKKIPSTSWPYKVYDIKTETNEFLLGGVQNHNTFHTGGAVDVIKQDLLKDIVQNDALANEQIVRKLLIQNNNVLACTDDCTITISKSDYPISGDLSFNDEKTVLTAKAVVCKVEFADYIFNIILDTQVEFQIYDIEIVGKDTIKLNYKKNSTILEVQMQTGETKAQIQYIERLLGGREIYKDANHLFLKLFKEYSKLRSMDSVHIEILLSQALRDKSNPSIPARLGKKWDPIMINIKQIVFKTSFVQGLAFENINEAIKTGLITEEGGEAAILEKVLTGTLVKGKK